MDLGVKLALFETTIFFSASLEGMVDELAQYRLGLSYEYGNNGMGKNLETAAEWYFRAAEQGYSDAQVALANSLRFGLKRNLGAATKWYTLAAEQGNVQAQYELGCCYEYGRGVEKNLDEAKVWYSKAAAENHEAARTRLQTIIREKEIH